MEYDGEPGCGGWAVTSDGPPERGSSLSRLVMRAEPSRFPARAGTSAVAGGAEAYPQLLRTADWGRYSGPAQLRCSGPTATGLTVFGRFWGSMSAIKFRQAVSNGPIELTTVWGCSPTSKGSELLEELSGFGREELAARPSAGGLGLQDKSFLGRLWWPLNQQRRPSISRQDQYSRVAGLSRHSMMVSSAFAVDKTPSRARTSTIAAILSLLRVI